MKNRKILAYIMFFCGLVVFSIPFVSNEFYDKEVNTVLGVLDIKVEELEETEISVQINGNIQRETVLDTLYREWKEYNENLYNVGQRNLLDPFTFEVASFDLSKYGIENNVAGSIYIERLDLKLPLYLGSSKENLAKGAAILGGTSMPIGGENTNTVIAAHRGMSTKEMFRNIQKIQIGDIIEIKNYWGTLQYRVIETKVVYPDDVESIFIKEGRELITLTSCHPYRHNYQRYLVFAEKIQ